MTPATAASPQIAYHQAADSNGANLGVLSVSSFDDCLATAAQDGRIHLWKISGPSRLAFACAIEATPGRTSLTCVRFSTCGSFLATCGDAGVFKVYCLRASDGEFKWTSLSQDNLMSSISGVNVSNALVDWFDLEWRGSSLCVGGLDGSVRIFDITLAPNGSLSVKEAHFFKEAHTQFVQGVALSPRGGLLASLSNDRTLRVSSLSNPTNNKPMVFKKDPNASVRGGCYADDSMASFFRRLSFSPDGKLLVVPAAYTDFSALSGDDTTAKKKSFCTQVFSTRDFSSPAAYLRCGEDGGSVGVRFHPKVFVKKGDADAWTCGSTHDLVFAVATLAGVCVYDTSSPLPIMVAKDFHYAEITDLDWFVFEGKQMLVASSRDGYLTFFDFGVDGLGTIDETVVAVEERAEVLEVPPAVEAAVAPAAPALDKKRVAPTLVQPPKKRIAPTVIA